MVYSCFPNSLYHIEKTSSTKRQYSYFDELKIDIIQRGETEFVPNPKQLKLFLFEKGLDCVSDHPAILPMEFFGVFNVETGWISKIS